MNWGERTRVSSVWSTIVATVDPTTTWRPMKAGSKPAPASVSTVRAGTAGTAAVVVVAGTAATAARWA